MDFQKVKAVLFDLDGTLLDTVRDIGACVNDVMRRYGFPTHDLDEYRAFVGHGSRNLCEKAVPEGTSDELIQKVADTYVPHYRENCTTNTTYFAGAAEFMELLQSRGVAIGMVTNKTQPTAERIMSHYFPQIRLSLLWGNNGERPLKPSVESAKLACTELGVRPEEVLFIGDGDTDMEYAANAGFYGCGVTWGYRCREDLLRAGAKRLIDSFDELAKEFQ